MLLAKQLLTDGALSVTEIAYAAGYGNLRRFNDVWLTAYGTPPSRLRRQALRAPSGTLCLALALKRV